MAALRACDLVKTSNYVQDAGDPVTPAQIFFITMCGHTNQLSAEGRRFANVLVDITPVVEKKARALDCVASQYYTGDLAANASKSPTGEWDSTPPSHMPRRIRCSSPRLLPSAGQRVPDAPGPSNSKSSRGRAFRSCWAGPAGDEIGNQGRLICA